MRRYTHCLLLCLLLPLLGKAQNESPYRTSFKIDAPAIVAGVGLSYWGLTLMHDKDALDSAKAVNLYQHKDDVNGFDRFSAGWYSPDAKKISDFPFYGSFGLPFLLLLDGGARSKAGQVGVLYVETMALTGTLFTMAAGNFPRTRPLVYGDPEDVPYKEKVRSNARNSFFAGHTAASAAASFFAAKVFHDFNPDSEARKYVWAGAALVPATVGYLRLRAGKHFLSDNLLGYAIGAGSGILVPQLHKKSDGSGISVIPLVGPYQGVALSYRLPK